MKADKSERREKKQHKARHGMRISGRSFVHIQNAILKRDKKIREKKEDGHL